MIPVILQVHIDRGQWVDVPVTPETMCRDVIECCREPGEQPCRLIQSMGLHEEAVPLDSHMMEVLHRWGENWTGVSFHLQYSGHSSIPIKGSRPFSPTEWMERRSWPSRELQEGSELSLAELRQMAARQQHQIEAHQQLLVAKEQRLKFLKQQEVRHQQQQQQQQQQQHNMISSVDADRLRHLKEKVELQELKLRRLRALRGQVEQHRSNNTNLSAELESIRALFNEKEKELSMAVAKVEELTRQLEDVRRGDMSGLRQGGAPSPAALEFQKLRRELLYRSKLNEQQNARIAQQRETLARRQSEISQMDQRIAELQQRLQRKRLLNQQLSSQLHAASRARPRANIAAVEPLKRAAQEIELIQDDLKVSAEVPEFTPNKKDPKYQTLPYNTKFSGTGNQDSHKLQNGEFEKHQMQNGGPPPYPDPPNSRLQPPNKPSPPHGLGNFSPRPFGTTYSTSSFLNSENGSRNRSQMPVKNPVAATSTTVNSSVSPSKPTITNSTSAGLHRSKPGTSFPSHQTVLPPTVMTSQTGAIRTVPQTPARQHPSPGYIHSHHLRLSENSPKPSVPPKPGIPSKPVLPPRQTYGSGISPSNIQKTDPVDQALSVLKGNNTNHRAPENYRLEAKVQSSNLHPRIPHPVIPQHSVTVTDSSIKSSKDVCSDSSAAFNHQPSNDSQESTPFSEVNSSNVRISLNRRIGMPPAFFFPENQPPPSDLGISDDSERMHLSRPRSVVLELSKLEPDGSLSATSKSASDVKESGAKEQSSIAGIDVLSDTPASPQKSALALSDLTDKSSSEQDSVNDSPNMCGRRGKKGNLKTNGTVRRPRRVSFDPLALLLDAALEGELELVKKTAKEVPNPSAANDEGITALHNAICAGHLEIVKFLVQFGCDVNAQDSDGWTPLHCAASCNNLQMVKYLVENGACIFATTLSDHETAAEKCEKEEEGFDGCSEYLYSMQEKLGILNGGVIYALYDYENQNADELSFRDGDKIVVLRKGDELEREWWWSKLNDREGYVPRNLIGLHPRVVPKRDP